MLTLKLNQGRQLFQSGFSQLPNKLFRRAYVTKCTSRDCILSRLSTNLREVDALEKMKDLILEMHMQDGSQLASIEEELERFKTEAAARGNTIDDDIGYRHAIYTDELTALTSANAQLSLMSSLLPSDSESVVFADSESDKSSSKAEAEKE